MSGQTDNFTALSLYMLMLATYDYANGVPRTKNIGIVDDVILVDENPKIFEGWR